MTEAIATGSPFCQLLGLWVSASHAVDLWDQVMKTWTLLSNGGAFIDTGSPLPQVWVSRGASVGHMNGKSGLPDVREVDVPWRRAGGWSAGLPPLNYQSPASNYKEMSLHQLIFKSVHRRHCYMHALFDFDATDMRVKHCHTAYDYFVIWRVKPRHSPFC